MNDKIAVRPKSQRKDVLMTIATVRRNFHGICSGSFSVGCDKKVASVSKFVWALLSRLLYEYMNFVFKAALCLGSCSANLRKVLLQGCIAWTYACMFKMQVDGLR